MNVDLCHVKRREEGDNSSDCGEEKGRGGHVISTWYSIRNTCKQVTFPVLV